jgi:hypothetical protein
LYSDTFSVRPGQLTYIRKKLTFSEDYKKYLSLEKKYRRPLLVSVGGSLLLSAVTTSNYLLMVDRRKKAEGALNEYKTLIESLSITTAYEEYSKLHDKYNNSRKLNSTLVVTSAVAIPVSIIYSYIYYRKHHSEFQPSSKHTGSITPSINFNNDYLLLGLNWRLSK